MPDFPIEVSAVAFDLDGTLVDTLPDLHEATNRTMRDLGLDAVAESAVRDFVGDGVDRLIKRLLTGAPAGEPPEPAFALARNRFREHYAAVLTRASRPFPGVTEALDALRARGLRLACVTNKPEAFTLPLLRALGLLERLDLAVAGDTLAGKKPDPVQLEHCAQRFGIPSHRLLMVGDSANDTRAARAAGCPVVCVPYGYRGGMTVQELDCDAIVASVADLMDMIRPVRS
jgi:phosphoglycolate phosphatase